MKTFFLIALTTALLIAALASCTEVPAGSIPPPDATGWMMRPAKKTMRAFRSEQELASYLHALAEKQKNGRRRAEMQSSAIAGVASNQAASPGAKNESDSKDESITNVQHAGVDEGGIVKLHGNHLVVLRRGRLFTVKIGDGALKPISAVDAFGPDINP